MAAWKLEAFVEAPRSPLPSREGGRGAQRIACRGPPGPDLAPVAPLIHSEGLCKGQPRRERLPSSHRGIHLSSLRHHLPPCPSSSLPTTKAHRPPFFSFTRNNLLYRRPKGRISVDRHQCRTTSPASHSGVCERVGEREGLRSFAQGDPSFLRCQMASLDRRRCWMASFVEGGPIFPRLERCSPAPPETSPKTIVHLLCVCACICACPHRCVARLAMPFRFPTTSHQQDPENVMIVAIYGR
ncbi:hypothetical protein GQ53DRAFT_456915 [Thozetella sp. PMI_491]|nr:hypothetical protein GQ53DRAFT_456915 [Thozetella sp. PMI_491]